MTPKKSAEIFGWIKFEDFCIIVQTEFCNLSVVVENNMIFGIKATTDSSLQARKRRSVRTVFKKTEERMLRCQRQKI